MKPPRNKTNAVQNLSQKGYCCEPTTQTRNWRSCPGGATCLYKHLGGAKALFCHVNHQVNGSARGDKTIQNFFHLGAMPPMPLQVHACYKEITTIVKSVYSRNEDVSSELSGYSKAVQFQTVLPVGIEHFNISLLK